MKLSEKEWRVLEALWAVPEGEAENRPDAATQKRMNIHKTANK